MSDHDSVALAGFLFSVFNFILFLECARRGVSPAVPLFLLGCNFLALAARSAGYLP